MKLTVLTETGAWNASTRYRALQHVDRLQARFASVDVALPDGPAHPSPGRSGKAAYFLRHGEGYARRWREVRRLCHDTDALFVQRGLYSAGPGAIVSTVRDFRGRIVVDLDDAVFQVSPSLEAKGRAARWLWGPQQALRLMKRADAIVVSTPTLAEMLPHGLVQPIILPTVPDPASYEVVIHRDAMPITIGWAGNAGGLGYLDPIRSSLERLASDGLAELEVVSSQPWAGPARFKRWTLAEESSVFRNFQVGIMPLPDHPYTRAKAGFKLLQYMASGLPVVASPVGINRELVERSGAGLLAETESEWYSSLARLAQEPDLRQRLGESGRRFIEAYADMEGQANTLTALLEG